MNLYINFIIPSIQSRYYIVRDLESQLNIIEENMNTDKNNTLETINNSPLNTSKSKAMFSFTKANRFMDLKQANTSFYDKPSMLNKRATSFGFGTKSELVNKYQNSPSPDKYTKNSEFQMSPKKGISIGLGRIDCKNVSIFNTSENPAPTAYSIQNKENSKVFTIRGKVKLPQLFPDKKTPGPGQYDQNLDKNGMCFNSKFKSNICYKIRDQNLSTTGTKYPVLGPLTYNTILSANGKQILSKKNTQKSFYFDRKTRVTLHVDSSSPGPGAYGYFSEFNR